MFSYVCCIAITEFDNRTLPRCSLRLTTIGNTTCLATPARQCRCKWDTHAPSLTLTQTAAMALLLNVRLPRTKFKATHNTAARQCRCKWDTHAPSRTLTQTVAERHGRAAECSLANGCERNCGAGVA